MKGQVKWWTDKRARRWNDRSIHMRIKHKWMKKKRIWKAWIS